jgi:hypothetical protein
MRLARITSRFDDLPDLYTFECRGCGVSHTIVSTLPRSFSATARSLSSFASFVSAAGVVRNQTGF